MTTQAIHIYLRELAFEYVVMVKKQWLGVQYRQQQVAWCTKHSFKTKESCRLEKEKLLAECLQQTNTGDGGKVGIPGGISSVGTTIVKIYTESMIEELYYDIL